MEFCLESRWLVYSVLINLIFSPILSHSNTIHLNNVWITQSGFAHFKQNKDWFFQLDIHLRLNTFNPNFRQNQDVLRIGRRLNENIDYSVGFGYLPTQLPNAFINEQRIWQQINFNFNMSNTTTVQIYNRVEHRWVYESSGISLRNRFKIVVKNCQSSAFICPFITSETFINMNRVVWDISKTLAQQRSMIGIEKRISKSVTLRGGYLNQFSWLQGNTNFSYDIWDFQMAFNFD